MHQKQPAIVSVRRISASALVEYGAVFPATSARNVRYYLGNADDGKWYYEVVLRRTERQTCIAGRGGVARAPRHRTLSDDLVCWAGDPCPRGGDHGWTQVSDQSTKKPNMPSAVVAEVNASIDRYIERWKRRLLIVTDGEIFQDGEKIGEVGGSTDRASRPDERDSSHNAV